MSSRRSFSFIGLILISCLTACGGGGGSSSDEPAEIQSPRYTGTYTPATFSRSNSKEFASNVLQLASPNLSAFPHELVYTYVSSAIYMGPDDFSFAEPCEQGRYTFSGSVGSDGATTLNIEYYDCFNLLNGWRDGQISIRYVVSGNQMTFSMDELDVTFTAVRIKGEDYNMYLNGEESLRTLEYVNSAGQGVKRSEVTRSLFVEDSLLGEQLEVDNIHLVYKEIFQSDVPAWLNYESLSGTLRDSNYGVVTLGLTAGREPETKVIRIQGKDDSSIVLDDSDIGASRIAFLVDVDGDSLFDLFANISAYVLGDESENIQAPKASSMVDALEVDLHNQAVISLDGFVDYDYDLLSFQFGVVAAPSGAAHSLVKLADGSLGFTADVEGSYTVQLIASDGVHASEPFLITINVVQPLPELVMTNPPTVNLGQPVTFDVVNVAANSPFVPRLVFGPSGMEIDDNGRVTWTPNELMFTPELAVNYAFVAGDSEREVVVKGSSVLVNEHYELPSVLHNYENFGHLSFRAFAGDVDGDGGIEIIDMNDAGILYSLSVENGGVVYDWAYALSTGIMTETKFAGILPATDNQHAQIVLRDLKTISFLDGVTKKTSGSFSIEQLLGDDEVSVIQLKVADVTGDGDTEVVMLVDIGSFYDSEKIVVFNRDLSEVIWQTPVMDMGRYFWIANMDGDSAGEVITSDALVFDGESGDHQWTKEGGFSSNSFNYISMIDIDNDGIAEAVERERIDGSYYFAVTNVDSKSIDYVPLEDSCSYMIGRFDNTNGVDVLKKPGCGESKYRLYSVVNGVFEEKDELAVDVVPEGSNIYTSILGALDVNGDGVDNLLFQRSDNTADLPLAVYIAGQGWMYESEASGYRPHEVDTRYFDWLIDGETAALHVPYPRQPYHTLGMPADGLFGTLTQWLSPVSEFEYFNASVRFEDIYGDGNMHLVGASKFSTDTIVLDIKNELVTDRLAMDDVSRDMVLTDLNGDGVNEVISRSKLGIQAFDTVNKQQLWEIDYFTENKYAGFKWIALAQLDDDPEKELIVKLGVTIYTYEINGSAITMRHELGGFSNHRAEPMALVDIDSDGVNEIVIAAWNSDGSNEGETQLKILNADLQLVQQSMVMPRVKTLTLESGVGENITGYVTFTDGSNIYSSQRRRLGLMDLRSGEFVWQIQGFVSTIYGEPKLARLQNGERYLAVPIKDSIVIAR